MKTREELYKDMFEDAAEVKADVLEKDPRNHYGADEAYARTIREWEDYIDTVYPTPQK